MLDSAFLESLVRDAPDAVVVLRPNRSIEAANQAFRKLGLNARPGVDFMALVADRARERVLAELVKAAGGKERLCEVPHVTGRSDDEQVVEYRFFPCEGGRVAGIGRLREATDDAGEALGKAQAELTPTITYSSGSTPLKMVGFQGDKAAGNYTVVPYETGKSFSYSDKVAYNPAMEQSELMLNILGKQGKKEKSLQFAGSPAQAAQALVGSLEGAMMLARSYGEPARFRAVSDRLLAELGA